MSYLKGLKKIEEKIDTMLDYSNKMTLANNTGDVAEMKRLNNDFAEFLGVKLSEDGKIIR